jgi:nitroreductase
MKLTDAPALARILDEARWAPSGDNTQPWRFELRSAHALTVHGHDTRHDCVYDLRGEASQLALGALLQTIDLASSREGMAVTGRRRLDTAVAQPTFDLEFTPVDLQPDPMADAIRRRSVQRRAMHTRPLQVAEKVALQAAAGAGFELRWFESFAQRLTVARLLFASAKIRLTMPEAYEVHCRIIDWGCRESEDRVPDQALGASAPTLSLMRFGLASWRRVEFFNRFLAGTVMPRIELDFVPGLACAGHFLLLAERAPAQTDDFVAAGRAVQRVWLTATRLGLWQQPEMTPLIFARYARQAIQFTEAPGPAQQADRLADRLDRLLGPDALRAVWMGRLGEGPAPTARSVRRPLSDLMIDQKYQVPVT